MAMRASRLVVSKTPKAARCFAHGSACTLLCESASWRSLPSFLFFSPIALVLAIRDNGLPFLIVGLALLGALSVQYHALHQSTADDERRLRDFLEHTAEPS